MKRIIILALIIASFVGCETNDIDLNSNDKESIEEENLKVETNEFELSVENSLNSVLNNKIKAIESEDYDLYMSTITNNDAYYFNEQERWFKEMSDERVTDLSYELLEITVVNDETVVADIKQKHYIRQSFDFTYPVLFKYEEGSWKDYGYNFSIIEKDRYLLRYMENETKVEEFTEIIDLAFENVENIYSERLDYKYDIKLFDSKEMLRQRTVPTIEWLFTGWSEPDESLKLFSGHEAEYKGYPGVIQHELVHHITMNICNNNLSLWLYEGIAMHDGVAPYPFNYSSLLSKLDRNNVKITISDLEAMASSGNISAANISQYYNTSYMYVEYIIETYGHDKLLDIFYEAGKKPFHDSALDDSFISNNSITTGEVLESVLGKTKAQLSNDYLEWVEITDHFDTHH